MSDASDDDDFEAWYAGDHPATDAMRHIPDRGEVRALLDRYFVGPVGDAAVERAAAEFRAAYDDDGLRAAYNSDFHSRLLGRGDAWREELSRAQSLARPIDLVMVIAHMAAKADASRPQPRPYCPAVFAGTWEQLEPTGAARWELRSDGAFHSTSTAIPTDRVRWYVVRKPADDRYSLVLRDTGLSMWSLQCTTPTDELVGVHLAQFEKIPFRLRRVVP
jgi:hypothetical protein